MSMHRKIGLLVSMAVMLGTASMARASEKVTFVMAGDALFNIVQYVAEDGGFLRNEGVVPDIVNVVGGPRQVAAILGKSADVAPLGFPSVVNAASQGGEIVAIATTYDVLSIALVLSNDAVRRTGITDGMPIDEKVKRLRGLRLGITSAGAGTDTMARALFAARGMNPDKEVTIQPLGAPENIITAFSKGVTDGFFYTSPMPETAVARGLGKIVIEPLTGEVPELNGMLYVVLATSRHNLANKRPQVEAVVRAYAKAMKFIHEKPDEARRITRKRFPDVDEGIFNAAFAKYVRGVPTSPLITPEQVKRTIDWMNLMPRKPITASYLDLVYPDLARALAPVAAVR